MSRVAAMADKYRRGMLRSVAAPGGLPAWRRKRWRTIGSDGCLGPREGHSRRLPDHRAANEYIAETQPWALERDERQADRLSQVLYDVAEAVRVAAILLLPVIPRSASEILRRVGEATTATGLRLEAAAWRNEGERTIVKGDALWPRAENVKAGASISGTVPQLRN